MLQACLRTCFKSSCDYGYVLQKSKRYRPSELILDNVIGWFDIQITLSSWKCPYSHSWLMDSQYILHAAAAESDL